MKLFDRCRVPLLVVIPTEELSAEGVYALEGTEALLELRPVLDGPELALTVGGSLLVRARLQTPNYADSLNAIAVKFMAAQIAMTYGRELQDGGSND